jgi:hypothetical protein
VPHHDHRMIEDALTALYEATFQASMDLVGEQRDFILPRLDKATRAFMEVFPNLSVAALGQARDAWGDRVYGGE